ncbi:MAG: S1 RNA-binding domain-containing protein [Rhodobacterales bacterium]|nr:S1 RNA-binding domain-containing protein [Rhodobacterales bacterium]
MSAHRTFRRRKDETAKPKGEIERVPEAPVEPPAGYVAPPRRQAKPVVPVIDRVGPVLETEDLMALATMDADELAALMEGATSHAKVEMGKKVTGTISRISDIMLFVDLGTKAEASIARTELPDAVVGDTIEAMVLDVSDFGITLSMKLSGEAAFEYLDEALANQLPIEGKVVSKNRGGFEVMVGGARAFCPISRISRLPETDPDALIGRTLSFRVLETGEKIVLDRRVLQQEAVAETAEALWSSLEVGYSTRGVVRNVQPFGVFVDMGGVDGMIPNRELIGSAPSVGSSLEVRVLEIDHTRKRVTLSARNSENDPWGLVGVEFHSGGVYTGTVVRITDFGAFVDLAEGLTGLVHASRMTEGLPEVGSAITVKIASVDTERQRLQLVPTTEDATSANTGEMAKGFVSEVLSNGVVIQLEDGRTGWLPSKEVELPPGTVIQQRFRRGKAVEARVVSGDERRVNLSLKSDPTESSRAWRGHQTKNESFGTMAGLFGSLKLPKK